MAPTSHSSEPCGACGWMKKLLFGGGAGGESSFVTFFQSIFMLFFSRAYINIFIKKQITPTES